MSWRSGWEGANQKPPDSQLPRPSGGDSGLALRALFLCPWMDGMPRAHGCAGAANVHGWRSYAAVAWMRRSGE
jgi:hypothetical protein